MPIKVKVATGRGFEVLKVIRDNEGGSIPRVVRPARNKQQLRAAIGT